MAFDYFTPEEAEEINRKQRARDSYHAEVKAKILPDLEPLDANQLKINKHHIRDLAIQIRKFDTPLFLTMFSINSDIAWDDPTYSKMFSLAVDCSKAPDRIFELLAHLGVDSDQGRLLAELSREVLDAKANYRRILMLLDKFANQDENPALELCRSKIEEKISIIETSKLYFEDTEGNGLWGAFSDIHERVISKHKTENVVKLRPRGLKQSKELGVIFSSNATPEEIGRRIRAEREAQGLSQLALAQVMGLKSKRTVANLEKGESSQSISSVQAVMAALGISEL